MDKALEYQSPGDCPSADGTWPRPAPPPAPREVVRQHLRVLTAQARQLPVVRLRISLVLVVLHGGVVGVEPDLKARYRDNAVDSSLSAAQPPACGQEVMTVPTIMVDDDPHLLVVAEV